MKKTECKYCTFKGNIYELEKHYENEHKVEFGKFYKIGNHPKPSEKIRLIWDELKELQRYRTIDYKFDDKRRDFLEDKYEKIETMFRHESSFSKTIIYYLDNLTT